MDSGTLLRCGTMKSSRLVSQAWRRTCSDESDKSFACSPKRRTRDIDCVSSHTGSVRFIRILQNKGFDLSKGLKNLRTPYIQRYTKNIWSLLRTLLSINIECSSFRGILARLGRSNLNGAQMMLCTRRQVIEASPESLTRLPIPRRSHRIGLRTAPSTKPPPFCVQVLASSDCDIIWSSRSHILTPSPTHLQC